MGIVIDRPADGIAVLHLPNPLTPDTAPAVRRGATGAIAEHRTRLVLAFAGADVLTPAGLSVLAAVGKRARDQGGSAVLADVTQRVTKALADAGLLTAFAMFRTVADALTALEGEG